MSAPYVLYHSECATVIHGDALDYLPTLATESADLIVTDPPYGVEWQSRRRADQFELLAGDGADVDSRAGIRLVLAELVRIVGQNRHLYVFGPTDVLDGLKVAEAVALVWDKTVMSGGDVTGAPWGPAHEPLTFTVSKHRHGGQAGATSNPARIRKGSVLRFARPTGRKVRHPSEKPIGLLRELIESSSRAGELVVDPFAGIGSTGVAAILAGRRAILCELDADYAIAAVDRIRRAEAIAAEGAAL